MKILICGGRDFSDREFIYETLDAVLKKHGEDIVIVHGAQTGADLLAEDWAKSREIEYMGFPAKWKKLKNAAGPERNKRQREKAKPEACIAFKGGTGTKGMCRLMEAIGVTPWLVGWDR